jgi:hypothetical protein
MSVLLGVAKRVQSAALDSERVKERIQLPLHTLPFETAIVERIGGEKAQWKKHC